MTDEIRTWSDPADIPAPIVDSYQVLAESEIDSGNVFSYVWSRVMATFRWPAVDFATAAWHCLRYRGQLLKAGITNTNSPYIETDNIPTVGANSVTIDCPQAQETVRVIPAGAYFQVWGDTTDLQQEPDPTIYKTTADAFCGFPAEINVDDVAACCHDQADTVYFTCTSPTNALYKMNWDGSGLMLIKTLTAVPRGIAIDTENEKLYWLEDTPALKSCDLDGSNTATVLVLNASSQPRGMDYFNGYLYWADTWSNTVNRCTTAGAGFTNLISGLSDPFGVRINTKTAYQKIYISDPGDGKIKYANLDGTGLTDGSTGHGALLGGLDIDTSRAGAGVMYFVVGDELYYWYISYFSPVVVYSSPDNVNQTDVCVDRNRSVCVTTCNGDGYLRVIGGEGANKANLKFTPVSTQRWHDLGAAARLYFFVPQQCTAGKPTPTETREITMEMEYATAKEVIWTNQ